MLKCQSDIQPGIMVVSSCCLSNSLEWCHCGQGNYSNIKRQVEQHASWIHLPGFTHDKGLSEKKIHANYLVFLQILKHLLGFPVCPSSQMAPSNHDRIQKLRTEFQQARTEEDLDNHQHSFSFDQSWVSVCPVVVFFNI